MTDCASEQFCNTRVELQLKIQNRRHCNRPSVFHNLYHPSYTLPSPIHITGSYKWPAPLTERESSVNKRPATLTVLDVRDRFGRVFGARADEVSLVPLKGMEM